MKKAFLVASVCSMFAMSCKDHNTKSVTTEEQAVAKETGTAYKVDEQASSVKWTGYHKGGLTPRFGLLKTTGSISSENNEITGGSFTMDMNSILTDNKSVNPAESDGKTGADLDVHLKNADFFDIEKYPTSKFDITKVEKIAGASTDKSNPEATHTISGNLKIKDKTVNVTFPAKVSVTENGLSLQSKFSINRQDWGLTYVAEGNPKDWVIAPEIDFELNITATK